MQEVTYQEISPNERKNLSFSDLKEGRRVFIQVARARGEFLISEKGGNYIILSTTQRIPVDIRIIFFSVGAKVIKRDKGYKVRLDKEQYSFIFS